MTTPKTYPSWAQVPTGLYSRAQLAEMEFPRTPGPVAGWVTITNWRHKREDLELFALAESTPTAATVAQLEAARRRSGRTRTCADCGAIGDLVLRRDPPLCRACAHIASLREHQEWLAGERPVRARRIAALWGQDPSPVVLYVRRVRPPRKEGARLPAAVALEVDATVDARRQQQVLRLGGRRNRHVPAEAVPLVEGGVWVAELLRGRTPLVWGESGVEEVRGLRERLLKLDGVELGDKPWAPVAVGGMVSVWRGQASVTVPGGIRSAVDPGRSDRLAALLERIAASAGEHNGRGTEIGSAAVGSGVGR